MTRIATDAAQVASHIAHDKFDTALATERAEVDAQLATLTAQITTLQAQLAAATAPVTVPAPTPAPAPTPSAWRWLLTLDAARFKQTGITPPHTFDATKEPYQVYRFPNSNMPAGVQLDGVMGWDGKNFIATYPAGTVGGSGRYMLEIPTPERTPYLKVTLRGNLSLNAQGHPVEWKRLHFFKNGRNVAYLTFKGVDANPLVPHLALQGIANLPADIAKMTSAGPLANNVKNGIAVTRGQEHVIVVELAERMKLTVNSVLVADYPDYLPVGTFDTVKDNATWGGAGGVVIAAMSLMTSSLLIEGR